MSSSSSSSAECYVLEHVRKQILDSTKSKSKSKLKLSDIVLKSLDEYAWNLQWMMFVGDGT